MTQPTTPTVWVDDDGIHCPPFDEVLSYMQAQYRAIYGDDVYLGNDSQDGQWISIIAQAISDTNSSAVAVYEEASPATAQGVGLSTVVKINGISRQVPSSSVCEVTLVGQAYQTITNGVVEDNNGFLWSLPASVTFPPSGTITVTATCQTLGAINAGDDSLTGINTPTFGWQTVTNSEPATPGAPVETDAQLRIRQGNSTMVPAQTLAESLVGQLEALPGVGAGNVTFYENDTDEIDVNGMPGHSICAVVTGGDDQLIANTIQIGKGLGVNTYGSSSATYTYSWGLQKTVNFQRPVFLNIFVSVVLQAKAGYTTNLQAQINAAIVAWIVGLGVGVNVEVDALRVPAYLNSATQPKQYKILSIEISAVSFDDVSADDVLVSFIQQATTSTANVLITPSP